MDVLLFFAFVVLLLFALNLRSEVVRMTRENRALKSQNKLLRKANPRLNPRVSGGCYD